MTLVSAVPDDLDTLARELVDHGSLIAASAAVASHALAAIRGDAEYLPRVADPVDAVRAHVRLADEASQHLVELSRAMRDADGGVLLHRTALVAFALPVSVPIEPSDPPPGPTDPNPSSSTRPSTPPPDEPSAGRPPTSRRSRRRSRPARTPMRTVSRRHPPRPAPTGSVPWSAPRPLPVARLLDRRQRLVAVAASQLGYRERPGNRTAYGQWFGADGNPWCAMFVSWCLDAAGEPLTGWPTARGAARVADIRRWARRTGRVVVDPQPGDLLLIDRGNGKGHIGIVERVDADGAIHTIEGNTDPRGGSNGTQVARRVRRTGRHVTLVRP